MKWTIGVLVALVIGAGGALAGVELTARHSTASSTPCTSPALAAAADLNGQDVPYFSREACAGGWAYAELDGGSNIQGADAVFRVHGASWKLIDFGGIPTPEWERLPAVVHQLQLQLDGSPPSSTITTTVAPSAAIARAGCKALRHLTSIINQAVDNRTIAPLQNMPTGPGTAWDTITAMEGLNTYGPFGDVSIATRGLIQSYSLSLSSGDPNTVGSGDAGLGDSCFAHHFDPGPTPDVAGN